MHANQNQSCGKLRDGSPQIYDKEYFEKHCGPIPYRRDVPYWSKFFGDVADQLIRSLKPCTVLDVGCAIGFLVEAFWCRGVRTYGIDISEYAISQVPQDLRSFCCVLSATNPLPANFPQSFDLITCIEVLEHIPEDDARLVIENMASRTECILFSSTPHDLTEPTHVNVRPVIYWLQLFAEFGFYPDLRFDASFVSPQAFLVRKRMPKLHEEVLPSFSESINKNFQINAQREQIAVLTQSKQELQQQLEGEVGRRDKEIENLTEQIAAVTEARQRQLDEEIGRRDKEIDDLRAELLQVNQKRNELNEILERERAIRSALEAQVEVLERDAGSLRSATQQLEGEFEGLRSTARQLGQEMNRLQALLTAKDLEIAEHNRKIASLELAQSGLFWELLVAYRRAKDRWLPPGTRRRRWYDRGLSVIKGIGNYRGRAELVLLPLRHPIRALRNLDRVNVEKFFYNLSRTDPVVVEAKLKRKLGLNEPPPQPSGTQFHKFGLIISGCPGDAFRYRCEHQAEQLRFFGLTVDTGYFDQIDYQAALECYECYWLHRVPYTDQVQQFILAAQEMGKPVIFDTDDLIFDEETIPYIRALEWMPKDEVDLYYDGVRRYYRTLSLCRFVTVTTEPLRDAIRRLLPQIQCFINPNALSDAQVRQAEEASRLSRSTADQKHVRIAYFSGTRTHNVDFRECSKALTYVLDRYPTAKLMLVGHLDVSEEFDRFGERVEKLPLLPWQELPKLLRNVDINLAPLELNNPFTEAKSALKYFEAAVMGVPTVASDVRAYRGFINHGENGFLCRSEGDWIECLSCLIKNADLRHQMGTKARNHVLDTLTTRAQAPRFRGLLNNVFQVTSVCVKETVSIAFVLRAPIAQVGGGYKVIFRLAHYLARQGHDVHLYVEPVAHLEGRTEAQIIEFCKTYFGESPANIHVGHHSIRPSDIAIATNWPTAFVVDSLVNTRCKAYLIQDYEPDFYDEKDPLREEVEKTYRLPLKKICIGRYLGELFGKRDRLPTDFFDFPLDHEIFYAENRKNAAPIRLLFFARPSLKRRGYSIGIEALKRALREHPGVEIWLYGMEESPKLPFQYRNLGVLEEKQLADAMRDADIHLSFSLSNISQVAFQAMACGCAVIEAKVPSVETMVEDGTNCLLAEAEPNAVAAALVRLIKDDSLRQRLAACGVHFVREKTWKNACKQFERIIFDSLLKIRRTDEKSLGGDH